MKSRILLPFLFAALPLAIVAAAAPRSHAEDAPAAAVTDSPKKQLEPAHLKALTEAVGAKPGVTKGKVHTITLPRTDLDVNTLEFGDVPVEAGFESTFHLFRCGCGKYYVIGQFCVTDYESNDVIDALRANATMAVVSVSPMLLQEKPRILLIRFQGGGEIDAVTKNLKEAARWIGEARTKSNPIKLGE
jgi:hypothetical protein